MIDERVAFTRVFASAPIGRSVAAMLAQAFPELTVDTINVTHLLKKRPLLLAVNGLVTAGLYGPDIIQQHKRPRSAFMATPFLHRRANRLIRQAVLQAPHRYRFTFQLQSLFNGAVPGIPHFIYTDHTHLANLDYDGFHRRSLYSKEWLKLEKETYDRAAHIFTRSTNISRSLIEQYEIPTTKITCVFAGANTRPPAFVPAADRYAAKHILFVGLDWVRKGGPELLAAFQQVAPAHPDAHLTIVGAAPAVDHPQITITGPLPVDEIHRYYQEASIFCLPTRLEPFGIVFIEAMSYRLPIVATNVGAIPDFVEDGVTGLMVEPGDAAGLAAALDRLLHDRAARQKMGEAAFELAQTRYNWPAVGRAIRKKIEEKVEHQRTNIQQPIA